MRAGTGDTPLMTRWIADTLIEANGWSVPQDGPLRSLLEDRVARGQRELAARLRAELAWEDQPPDTGRLKAHCTAHPVPTPIDIAPKSKSQRFVGEVKAGGLKRCVPPGRSAYTGLNHCHVTPGERRAEGSAVTRHACTDGSTSHAKSKMVKRRTGVGQVDRSNQGMFHRTKRPLAAMKDSILHFRGDAAQC